jgi:hypothetical protein
MSMAKKTKKDKSYDPPPALIKPEGNGYMPLFSALLWIATRGFAAKPNKPNNKTWTDAYQQLVNAVASEKVKAMGRRGADSEAIPAALFAACPIVGFWEGYSQSRALSDEMYLRGGFYANHVQWIDHSDQLVVGVEIIWKQIVVQKSDVGREWPYHLITSANRSQSDHRDAPDSGKASARSIVPLSLQIQIHPDCSKADVIGLLELNPAATKLLLVLEQAYATDQKSRKPLEDWTWLSTKDLAEELRREEPAVRQVLSRLRREVGEAYEKKFGVTPSEDIFIEHCRKAKGYRINPHNRFVAYPQSPPVAVSHAPSQTAVTSSKKSPHSHRK